MVDLVGSVDRAVSGYMVSVVGSVVAMVTAGSVSQADGQQGGED